MSKIKSRAKPKAHSSSAQTIKRSWSSRARAKPRAKAVPNQVTPAARLAPTGTRSSLTARSKALHTTVMGPRSATPLNVVHDADRNVHFATFGKLPSEAREAAVQRGLPARFLTEALAILRVTRAELLESLGIASSTAARVAQQARPFPSTDSERLALLARLWNEVVTVYEDEAGARAWITGPVPSVGGIPLRLLKSYEGFERAQRSILQLAYGVYA